MRIKLLSCAAAAALSVFGAFTGAHAQETEFNWRIQAPLQAGEPGYLAVEHFADVVDRLSGGRMKFEVYPVDAIFPVPDGLDAIGAGVIEAAVLTGAIYQGQLGPIASLESGVPGSLFSPIERFNLFYEAGFIDLAREAFQPFGIYYLGPQFSPGWDIFSTKPIRSIEDFQELRMRAYGIEGDWFSAMGASTVMFGGGEIYTSLATGVIDAARWSSPAANLRNSFHEVAKYYIQPSSIAVPNNFFAVNEAAWSRLPDDLKAILEEATLSSSWDYIARADMADAAALAKMQESGVEVITISDENWAEIESVAREFWEAYADDDDLARRGVEMLQAFLKELGR